MGNVINKIVKCFKTCWNPTTQWEEEDITSSSDSDSCSEENKCMFSPNNPKKALLIGINYSNSSNALNGCINDVVQLRDFIKNNLYFNDDNIMTMRDDNPIQSMLYPTKFNIQSQIHEMVKWANNNSNSELWFSFSGHGSYVFDNNDDEKDGKDEVLCTVDNKYIKDDWIKSNFIDKLNHDVKLFILIDACHSGTMCDLSLDKKKIIMFSGCRDDQTASDAFIREEQEFRGALTHSFINSWDKECTISEHHSNLLKSMNGKYTQTSVISATCSTLNNFQLC